ncbi:MAG: hypothetical protein WCC37_21920 [Candidatus Sulfotelmatobacter sp.]
MKTKFESNSFEGMRVIADYNVGDQRIIVLERSNSTQEAVTRQKTSAPAKPAPPMAARSTSASIEGAVGPRPGGASNLL